MGLVTANIQPIEPGEARSVPSASGAPAIAVIEVDGFGRHNTRKLIAAPGVQAPALSSPVAIKLAMRAFTLEGRRKWLGKPY
jgi:hypothetical protein